MNTVNEMKKPIWLQIGKLCLGLLLGILDVSGFLALLEILHGDLIWALLYSTPAIVLSFVVFCYLVRTLDKEWKG